MQTPIGPERKSTVPTGRMPDEVVNILCAYLNRLVAKLPTTNLPAK